MDGVGKLKAMMVRLSSVPLRLMYYYSGGTALCSGHPLNRAKVVLKKGWSLDKGSCIVVYTHV